LPVDQRVVMNFVDETREFEVKTSEVPPPSIWWIAIGIGVPSLLIALYYLTKH